MKTPAIASVPPYEERAEQLLAEAARLISVMRATSDFPEHWEDAERWFERYGLHGSQTDYPDLRSKDHA